MLIYLNPHATEIIFHTPFQANKMELLIHSTTSNAPYIHPSHDSILEFVADFPKWVRCVIVVLTDHTHLLFVNSYHLLCPFQFIRSKMQHESNVN